MSRLLFDPQALPIDEVAGEPALAEDRLSIECIRACFANPSGWNPEVTVEPRLHEDGGVPVLAAVLIPIIEHANGASLLLTQRAAHLNDHAGQISFPGGRAESGDRDVIDTALRETEEEIGLHARHIEVLGTLPDYFTATGYRVAPVVAVVQPPFELKADALEVEEIFEVPLAFLMNGMHHQRRSYVAPSGSRRSFYAMPYDRHFIWGATAGMIRNLFHFLRA